MEPLSRFYKEEFSLKQDKLFVFTLLIVVIFDYLLFPLPLLASNSENMEKIAAADITSNIAELYMQSAPNVDEEKNDYVSDTDATTTKPVKENKIESKEAEKKVIKKEKETIKINIKEEADNHLPTNKVRAVKSSGVYALSAYNSEVSQCDGDPCTTANGFNVCKHGIEDTVAANFLPFGTKIRIPELFGDRIFIVRDRMNPRYQNKIDVWMKKKHDAIDFGVRTARVEIVK